MFDDSYLISILTFLLDLQTDRQKQNTRRHSDVGISFFTTKPAGDALNARTCLCSLTWRRLYDKLTWYCQVII